MTMPTHEEIRVLRGLLERLAPSTVPGAPVAGPVEVKPLAWRADPTGRFLGLVAETLFGEYRADKGPDGTFEWLYRHAPDAPDAVAVTGERGFDTIDAAVVAADADHARRVRASLA